MVQCSNCQEPLKEDWSICPYCGEAPRQGERNRSHERQDVRGPADGQQHNPSDHRRSGPAESSRRDTIPEQPNSTNSSKTAPEPDRSHSNREGLRTSHPAQQANDHSSSQTEEHQSVAKETTTTPSTYNGSTEPAQSERGSDDRSTSSQREQTSPTPDSHTASTNGINLMQGETVIENVRPAWSNWWKQLLLALSIVVLGVVTGVSDVTLATAIIAAIIIGYVAMSRSRSRYIVTDQRIKKNVGLLSSKSGEVRISDIKGLQTASTFLGGLTGKGTVNISAGGSNNLGIKGISKYEDVATAIREQQHANE